MTLVAAGLPAQFVLLAANVGEWIVPLVVFIVWIINQVLAANKAKPAPPRPQVPVPPAGGKPPQAGQGQGALVDEVERFLQEARKAMNPEQKQKPGPRPAAAKSQGRGGQRPPKSQQQKKQQPPQRKTLAERTTLKPQAADRELDDIQLGGSVSQHVQKHLDTSRFDERAGKLSQLRQTVDQDIGGHVKGAFDHPVGTLGVQSGGVRSGSTLDKSGAATTANDDPTGVNSVVQIVAMLSNPQSMRNAIILQEILAPPTERW